MQYLRAVYGVAAKVVSAFGVKQRLAQLAAHPARLVIMTLEHMHPLRVLLYPLNDGVTVVVALYHGRRMVVIGAHLFDVAAQGAWLKLARQHGALFACGKVQHL